MLMCDTILSKYRRLFMQAVGYCAIGKCLFQFSFVCYKLLLVQSLVMAVLIELSKSSICKQFRLNVVNWYGALLSQWDTTLHEWNLRADICMQTAGIKVLAHLWCEQCMRFGAYTVGTRTLLLVDRWAKRLNWNIDEHRGAYRVGRPRQRMTDCKHISVVQLLVRGVTLRWTNIFGPVMTEHLLNCVCDGDDLTLIRLGLFVPQWAAQTFGTQVHFHFRTVRHETATIIYDHSSCIPFPFSPRILRSPHPALPPARIGESLSNPSGSRFRAHSFGTRVWFKDQVHVNLTHVWFCNSLVFRVPSSSFSGSGAQDSPKRPISSAWARRSFACVLALV